MQPQHQRQAARLRAALLQGALHAPLLSRSAVCARVTTVLSGGCGHGQIAERDVRILRVLGRGASSVVRTQCCVVPAHISPE